MVKLRKADQQEFDRIVGRYLNEPEVKQMENYIAHGKVSVLEHSLNVARTAYDLALEHLQDAWFYPSERSLRECGKIFSDR